MLLLISLLLAFQILPDATGCSIKLVNQCPFPVTACAQTTAPNAAAAGPISQYNMTSNSTQTVYSDNACSFPSGVVYVAPSGKCAASSGSNGATTDRNSANLAELNLVPSAGPDNYDISDVGGYNINMQIKPNNSSCSTRTCIVSDFNALCQKNNAVVNFPGGNPTRACQNNDGRSPSNHGPTDSTKLFKDACPDAYSYDYDDKTSLVTCPHGADYDIILCPVG